ncbi:MAG: hypothetical protein MMC23_007161 [Stictis urceolatum]|nr:hypothetical protein [Stictis urceolata]
MADRGSLFPNFARQWLPTFVLQLQGAQENDGAGPSNTTSSESIGSSIDGLDEDEDSDEDMISDDADFATLESLQIADGNPHRMPTSDTIDHSDLLQRRHNEDGFDKDLQCYSVSRSRSRSPGLPDMDFDLPLNSILAAGKGAQRRRASPRKTPFHIYHEILLDPQSLGAFASNLPVRDLLTLYSVCKDFHKFVDSASTAVMVSNARNFAPESMKIFHWRCYRGLTKYDPNMKINELVKTFEGRDQARDVPSLKWLRMVHEREETVDSIIFELAEAGHRLPSRASKVIKKIWLMMDMPVNGRRISLIHSRKFWTDSDLYVATMFFIKLDMRFNDPLDADASTHLRELMLAQRTMTVLDDVLQRTEMRTRARWLQMYVEWAVDVPQGPLPERFKDASLCVFGVPRVFCGRLKKECWTVGKGELLRPDLLIVKEAIRRDLFLEKWYLDMFLWGYIDTKTGKDIWPISTELAVRRAANQIGFENLPEWAKTVDMGEGDNDDELLRAFNKLGYHDSQDVVNPETEEFLYSDDDEVPYRRNRQDKHRNKKKRRSSNRDGPTERVKRQETGPIQGESSAMGAQAGSSTQAGSLAQANSSNQTLSTAQAQAAQARLNQARNTLMNAMQAQIALAQTAQGQGQGHTPGTIAQFPIP